MARALLIFAALVLIGSMLPDPAKRLLETNRSTTHPILHLAAFAVIAFLACSLARSRPLLLAALLASIAFGVLIEVLEAVAYRQKLETADIWLDAYGSAFGLLLSLFRRRPS